MLTYSKTLWINIYLQLCHAKNAKVAMPDFSSDFANAGDGRHLERGVIAELLQPGAPLEFFSQKASWFQRSFSCCRQRLRHEITGVKRHIAQCVSPDLFGQTGQARWKRTIKHARSMILI